MKKEVKRDYIETSFPFPEISVFFISIVALMVYPLAPSSKQWNDWVFFHFLLIAGILVLSAPIVILDWPFHPRCTISRKLDHRYFFGKVVSYYLNDGRPSIGRVQVVRKNDGNVVWEYFCSHCDPDKPYFRQVLCERYKEVFTSSMVIFWLVEKERDEDDRRREDHEDEPPDIRLSS